MSNDRSKDSSKGPYLHGHHASVLRSHSWRTVENSCPHLIPHLTNPSLKILDVGCGPGTISIDLARRVPDGFVYATDISLDVIEKARRNAKEAGVTNVRFEVGDIFNTGDLEGMRKASGGEGFDVVHAHQVLQHLQDPLTALKTMKSLAKKGGIIAIRDVDYSAMTWYPEIPGLREWSDLYIATAHSINCDPNIGKRLHAVAMQAGFARKDIETSGAVWVFSTPEEREWWCGLWADRVVNSDYKDRVLGSGLGTEEDLKKCARAFKELEGCEEGWFSVLHGQVVCHV